MSELQVLEAMAGNKICWYYDEKWAPVSIVGFDFDTKTVTLGYIVTSSATADFVPMYTPFAVPFDPDRLCTDVQYWVKRGKLKADHGTQASGEGMEEQANENE